VRIADIAQNTRFCEKLLRARPQLTNSQEMDVPDNKTGLIWSCANAGLAIGALGFGLLVDIIGRKWAFNLTCLICSVFGMLLVCRVLVPPSPLLCLPKSAFLASPTTL
jgi:MFS family permease